MIPAKFARSVTKAETQFPSSGDKNTFLTFPSDFFISLFYWHLCIYVSLFICLCVCLFISFYFLFIFCLLIYESFYVLIVFVFVVLLVFYLFNRFLISSDFFGSKKTISFSRFEEV